MLLFNCRKGVSQEEKPHLTFRQKGNPMKIFATLHISRPIEIEVPEDLVPICERYNEKGVWVSNKEWNLVDNFLEKEAEQYLLRGQDFFIEINDIE